MLDYFRKIHSRITTGFVNECVRISETVPSGVGVGG